MSKKYSKQHEWVSLDADVATVGITDYAQQNLGDIVFIDLPKINNVVTAGSEVCVIESVKAASDIYSPLDGEIIEINNSLDSDASTINSDPENQGWIFKLKISNETQMEELMNDSQYQEYIKEL